MFIYNKDGREILEDLKRNGYNTTRMRKEKLLNESAIQALRKNEIVGIKSLDAICTMLECQPNNIIRHILGET